MGCSLCGICRPPATRTVSDMKQGPLQAKLIRLVKTLPIMKNGFGYREFKQTQVALYECIKRCNPEEIAVQLSSFTEQASSPGKRIASVYRSVKYNMEHNDLHLFKIIQKKYSQFLTELFAIVIPDEPENISERNHELSTQKNEITYSMSVSQERISALTIDINQSPPNRPFNHPYSPNGNTIDYSELHYHRKNHSYEQMKKSLKSDKPSQIISQVQNQLDKNPELASAIIIQFNIMLQILRLILAETYYSQLSVLFPEPDDMPQKELFLQRILHHFLFRKYHPLHYIFPPALQKHYEIVDKRIKQGSVERVRGSLRFRQSYSWDPARVVNEPNLDKSLMPRSVVSECDGILQHDSSDLSSYQGDDGPGKTTRIFDEPIMEEGEEDSECPSALLQQHNYQPKESLKRKDVLNFIKKSELVAHDNQIPYHQTFPLLLRLIEEKKLWKKFQLTERIDVLIVQIFMRCRSKSQFGEFYDTITAADSKAEILFFILYKFSKAYPNVNIELQLYQPLRFINDFDGPLNDEIKNVFCQAFIRFFSMLDMFINSEV